MSTATQPRIYRGVEQQIGTVKSNHKRRQLISIPVSKPECAFLYHGLRDITAAIEAIHHNPEEHQHLSAWPRDLVRDHVMRIRAHLSAARPWLFLSNRLDARIIRYAVEQNRYFQDMRDGDPRLTIDQIRAANRLRERIATALGVRLARVPLGAGRVWIEDAL